MLLFVTIGHIVSRLKQSIVDSLSEFVMILEAERLGEAKWPAPWLRHQHIARYRWVLSLVENRRVLDAACGTGFGSRMMIEGGARSVLGLDLSEETIESVKRAMRIDGLTFQAGDVTSIPLENECLDAYVSFETIEHIPDDRQYLREASRVLSRGGRFICSTPNRLLTNPGKTIIDKPFNPFHIREHSVPEFAGLLKDYFPSVQLLGQTPFSDRYAGLLARIGRMSQTLAFRTHQVRKMMGIPWEGMRRHWPAPMIDHTEYEVMIAVCTKE